MRTNTCTTIPGMRDALIHFFSEEARTITENLPESGVIIYGAGARGVMAFRALERSGIRPRFFIDSNPSKHGQTLCGSLIRTLGDLGEDTSRCLFILAADYPGDMEANLIALGIDSERQIRRYFDHEVLAPAIPIIAPMTLFDPILGHDRPWLEDGGFRQLHCGSGPEALRILVLGNSTTDPEVQFPTPEGPIGQGSWPLYLLEEFRNRGLSTTIHNAAMSAYTSSQELFKLIRDGCPLQPDLVIVYSGVNDASKSYWLDGQYPKIHTLFKRVEGPFRAAIRHHSIPSIASSLPLDGVSYGRPSQATCVEEWEQNARMMHAICDGLGMQFIYFLQPGGLYHSSYTQSCDVRASIPWVAHDLLVFWNQYRAKHAAMNQGAALEDSTLEGILSFYLGELFGPSAGGTAPAPSELSFDQFYKDASRMAGKHSFMVDLSESMHGIPDVFYDGCHCNIKGNKRVASQIFSELQSRKLLEARH